MPRRSPITLDDVTTIDTLTRAFWQAARGKGEREDVRCFTSNLDVELARLGENIRSGRAPEGRWTSFQIFDPKPRRILAPCFTDRVSRSTRPLRRVRGADRARLAASLLARSVAWLRSPGCRPSHLRRCLLGLPVSARAARRILTTGCRPASDKRAARAGQAGLKPGDTHHRQHDPRRASRVGRPGRMRTKTSTMPLGCPRGEGVARNRRGGVNEGLTWDRAEAITLFTGRR